MCLAACCCGYSRSLAYLVISHLTPETEQTSYGSSLQSQTGHNEVAGARLYASREGRRGKEREGEREGQRERGARAKEQEKRVVI